MKNIKSIHLRIEGDHTGRTDRVDYDLNFYDEESTYLGFKRFDSRREAIRYASEQYPRIEVFTNGK